MKKTELLKKLKALGKVSKGQRNAVVCSLIGHSRIVTGCFGYVYCGRCGDQIADQLGGSYSGAPESVRVGHNCATCRKNYKKLGWEDKLYAPNPFPKKQKKTA